MEDRSPNVDLTLKNPVKYKFLRRNLNISNQWQVLKLATYTKMKGIYFRKINIEYAQKLPKRRSFYSSEKQLNCVKHLDLALRHELHDKKLVKLLKNVKNVKLEYKYGYDTSIQAYIRLLRQIPKNIEAITISQSRIEATVTDLKSFYRNLSAYRKLKKLVKRLNFQQLGASLTEMEYDTISKCIPRIRNLEEYCVEITQGQQGFQMYMNKGQICPSVTDLSIILYNKVTRSGNEYDIRVSPLFRFSLFQRLRHLKIHAYTEIFLDPSISQGFKSLSQLKHFKLELQRRIAGRKFIFEGLTHLPALDQLHLSIFDIEKDEGLLLVELLQNQTHLVSLKLFLLGVVPSRQRYEENNQYLEMMCQSINHKPKLKYLSLDATALSLQTLSRGLNQLGTTNQLKELTIAAFDDLLIPSSSHKDKVKGLCDFIERQNLSLSSVRIILGCIKEDEILESLIKAIEGAHKLELLNLKVNEAYSQNSFNYNTLLQDIIKPPLKGYPSYNKTCALLNQVLPQLKHLSHLNLTLNPLISPFDGPLMDTSVILNTLLALKNMTNLSLSLPFMKSMKEYPAQGLLLYKNRNLITFNIETSPGSRFSESLIINDKEMTKISEIIDQQRYIRRNLTF